MKNRVFKTDKLPYLELRYISQIRSCDKKHQHSELTITAIEAGEIEIHFERKIDLLKPKQVSIVNPKEVHSATLTDIKSFGCYVLYLEKSWCEYIQQSLFETKNYKKIDKSLIKNSNIYSNFVNICNALFDKNSSFLEKEERLIEFISSLFLSNNLQKEDRNKNPKNSKIAFEIQNYLESNIENEILLKDIAKHLNLSVVHILRIFKQEFNLPIHSYLLDKKVHIAKELLSKNIPIAEVAQMSGFFDQSHLNRFFKRVFQLTPSEYQKNLFS